MHGLKIQGVSELSTCNDGALLSLYTVLVINTLSSLATSYCVPMSNLHVSYSVLIFQLELSRSLL